MAVAWTIPGPYEKSVKQSLNKGWKIITYDSDNAYPQRTAAILEASQTGVACANLFSQFIEGRGFEDEGFYQSIINRKGQTVDQLLRLISRDYARHGYFALHIGYNMLYEIDSLTRIDPRYVRLGLPDSNEYSAKVAVYNDWARDNYKVIKRQKIDYIDTFNPAFAQVQKERAEMAEEYWQGQCFLYTGEEQAYVKAPHDPVLVQMETEALIAKGRRAKFKNGTSVRQILALPHVISEAERKALASALSKQKGPEGDTLTILEGAAYMDANGAGTMPQMYSVDHTKGPDEMHSMDAADVRRDIIRTYNQPPILHGDFKDNGLSSADQIQNAFDYYNQFTIRARRVMEETFSRLIPLFKYDINPSGEYSILPLQFGVAETEETTDNGNMPDPTD